MGIAADGLVGLDTEGWDTRGAKGDRLNGDSWDPGSNVPVLDDRMGSGKVHR